MNDPTVRRLLPVLLPTTRYPNCLPGGVPFMAFGEEQAVRGHRDRRRLPWIGITTDRRTRRLRRGGSGPRRQIPSPVPSQHRRVPARSRGTMEQVRTRRTLSHRSIVVSRPVSAGPWSPPYRPAAALPAVTAAASVTMNIRKPCSMRSAMSSTPAVIPHGTPWAWQAANTRWIAASTASMSPS